MANPGKLNRRITLQAKMSTQDTAGGRVESWVEVGQVWAEMIQQRQSESVQADADRNVETTEFRIRYKADLSSGSHRVIYQGRTYDIDGVVQEGIRNTMRMTCRAVEGMAL